MRALQSIGKKKDYNGINKLLNLSEDDAKKLIAEKEQLKIELQDQHTKELEELKEVIHILENELKYTNQKYLGCKYNSMLLILL